MSGILQNFAYGRAFTAAPVNTVAPVVSGTATVGQTLSSTTGTWTGVPTPTFTYQWQRSGSNIGGATSSTYVLVAADYTNTIRCVVTATNSSAAVSANSNSTAAVAGTAPVNTVAPVVSGTAQVRQTLSSTTGTWTGTPTPTFTYQWRYGLGTAISGATSSTYVVTSAYVGQSIFCSVTATNAVGVQEGTSNSTSAIAANVPLAPTIGTATVATSTSATVTYTASSDNGGATITSYTATSSPGGLTGTVSTSGSGTITVTGLTTGTTYTFTVKANNSAGSSAASAASNSITPAAIGQATYTTPGLYTWVCPAGVTSISFAVLSAGAQGYQSGYCTCPCNVFTWGGAGGGGGGMGYKNNYGVTPGSAYSLQVGDPNTNGSNTYFQSLANYGMVGAYWPSYDNANTGGVPYGGSTVFTGWQRGGTSGAGDYAPVKNIIYSAGGGGGGAAGYGNTTTTGTGGKGCDANNPNGTDGQNGGGGGGGFGNATSRGGSGGGGVGYLGQGANGTAASTIGVGGGGGSGGANGTGATTNTGALGGVYGGGGGGGSRYSVGGNGSAGFVRIIWPGTSRSYPSTNTGDL